MGQAAPAFWWHLWPCWGCQHPAFQDYATRLVSKSCVWQGLPRHRSSSALPGSKLCLGGRRCTTGHLVVGDLGSCSEVGLPAPRSCCRMPTRLRCGPSVAHSLPLQPRAFLVMLHLPVPVTCWCRQPPHTAFPSSRTPPTVDKPSGPWSDRS